MTFPPSQVNASEQRLTVGFSSLRRPTFQFSAAVDFSKGMDNVHRAVEVKIPRYLFRTYFLFFKKITTIILGQVADFRP